MDPQCSSSIGTEHDFSDLDFVFDDNFDFDIIFDELDALGISSVAATDTNQDQNGFNLAQPDLHQCQSESKIAGSENLEKEVLGVSSNHNSIVDLYLNSSPSASGSCNSGKGSSNFLSPGSSQASDLRNLAVDGPQDLEVQNPNSSLSKRKKERDDEDGEDDKRNCKHSRTRNAIKEKICDRHTENSNFSSNDLDDKRKARLLRNRESAQLSRQRKKHYVEELENKVRTMRASIAELNNKLSFYVAENENLKQQLLKNGHYPPPVCPPMLPCAYPWMPCPPYVVKSHGSKVPLLPIPKLKPQQSMTETKAEKVKVKKGESTEVKKVEEDEAKREGNPPQKKTKKTTKKLTSVSLLSVMLFMFLFGVMMKVDVKPDISNFGAKSYDQHKRRILRADTHLNISHEHVNGDSEELDLDFVMKFCDGAVGNSTNSINHKEKLIHCRHLLGPTKFDRGGNVNDSLFASLYVPRNNKLVKIDGSLIISSVLASETAMASQDKPVTGKTSDTGLAIHAIPNTLNDPNGKHPKIYRNALPLGSVDASKSHSKSDDLADGEVQQWFHEGLEGPLLRSHTCTEVFQFDATTQSGAIVPTSTGNTTGHHQNSTTTGVGRNRRILGNLPLSLPETKVDVSNNHGRRKGAARGDGLDGNKPVSSIVVSVLIDPREASHDVDGMLTSKSLSRIFVVVLLDGVKYVTYSCILPRSKF